MKIRYLYPFVWFILVIIGSLSPQRNLPSIVIFEHADKVVHGIMYFIMTVLLIPALMSEKKYTKSYIFSFFTSAFCGLVMEFLQYSITNTRSADILDFFANCIGALLGIIFYQYAIRNKKIEKKLFKIE
ncbi:MAG: VanZ family protein [Bacteroidales bacterium]|nr:VanZ family protein [Bacteroidales bacterium]